MARLPRLMGRGRALEVLLGSEDIGGDLAQAYGYVNRSLPDDELDGFVDAIATRIASTTTNSRAGCCATHTATTDGMPSAQFR